ncbi:MAG TPA: cupredoxin domain-containing protein [Chloroflexota bacterium]
MLVSRAELVGGVFAILVVVGMGFLALHGPFNHINHVHAAVAPAKTVHIITNPKTIGQYVPATITVKVGQTIVFDNVSNADHTVTARDGSFNSANIATSASYTFTATKAGKFPYGCAYHPLMLGTIIVTS